jgi:hypothetical protein
VSIFGAARQGAAEKIFQFQRLVERDSIPAR